MPRLAAICLDIVARAFALCLGLYLIAGAACALIASHRDPAIWLLDTRWLPLWFRALLMLAIAIPFLDFAARTLLGTKARSATIAAAVLFTAIASLNALQFWSLLGDSRIRSDLPLPASALFAVLGVLIALAASRSHPSRPALRATSRALVLAASATLAALFPFLQMLTYGLTDYRRPADAILVFGARTYADGTPSDALKDRVLAACALYNQGLAPTLVLSGGPGDGDIHETDTMRRIAMDHGVPAERILLDRRGHNTRDSIRNTTRLCADRGLESVLAVSHFYHLPRIKVEANRAGLHLVTAPASQRGRILRSLPYFMARESLAWWWSLAKSA